MVPLPRSRRSTGHWCAHGLVQVRKRRPRREDYRWWERPRAMDLRQMDVMGRVFLGRGRGQGGGRDR